MLGDQHIAAAPPVLFLAWRGFARLQEIDYGRLGEYMEPVLGFVHSAFTPPHPVFLPVCFAAFMAGTLMPDLDSKKSKARKWLDRTLDKMEHRTWLHTAYAVAVVLALSLMPYLCVWMGSGYFVHLFLDSFSKCGVAWFKPKSGYRHFGKSDAKVKKGKHLVLYKTKTQAWVLCTILWCCAIFIGYLQKVELLDWLESLFMVIR